MLRLVEIFFRPARVFAAMRARPKWALPFTAAVLLSIATTLFIMNTVGIELMTLQRYQRDTRLAARVGEAKIESAVNTSNSRIPKLLLLSRTVGFTAGGLLVLAGVLTLAASALQATPRPGYARMLAATCYAVFPFALMQFVITLVMLGRTGDYGGADLEHLVSVSPIRFLDVADVSPVVVSLMQSLDLFILAQVVFLAYGFSKVAALPFFRCLAVCVAIWAVAAIWNAALASLF